MCFSYEDIARRAVRTLYVVYCADRIRVSFSPLFPTGAYVVRTIRRCCLRGRVANCISAYLTTFALEFVEVAIILPFLIKSSTCFTK